MADDEKALGPSLQNLLEQKSLKWIFVGGKGGVGKTTTSCSLAVELAKARERVLIISTDPAHNVSDAFNQKFGRKATQVNGVANLFALEVDPTVESESLNVLDSGTKSVMQELMSSFPGIDEAMTFAELMKQVQAMNYSAIVFDTAPTGHTLRLLAFPSLLEKAFARLIELKEKFSGLFAQVSGALGADAETTVMSRFEEAKRIISAVHKQFKDPNATTFVCVCIPEFLSLFETERLIQELAKFDIDSHNLVVNQVLMPDPKSECKKCLARVRMQTKYIEQIDALYDDFHVVHMPLLDEEVRGFAKLQQFGGLALLRSHAARASRVNAPDFYASGNAKAAVDVPAAPVAASAADAQQRAQAPSSAPK